MGCDQCGSDLYCVTCLTSFILQTNRRCLCPSPKVVNFAGNCVDNYTLCGYG